MSFKLKKARVADLPRDHVHEIVVIGGGVAGVSCAKELARISSDHSITLISASEILVESSCILEVSERLKEVKVFEKLYDQFNFENPNVHVHIGSVTSIDFCGKHIFLHDGNKISFQKLVICTGARANVILRHPSVISLRDSDTVEVLRGRLLHSARRVAILGNGGISLELVHALTHCEILWIVKNDYIGSAFFDASASAFILSTLLSKGDSDCDSDSNNNSNNKRNIMAMASKPDSGPSLADPEVVNKPTKLTTSLSPVGGYALGPHWLQQLKLKDLIDEIQNNEKRKGKLKIYYEQEIAAISTDGQGWTAVASGAGEDGGRDGSIILTDDKGDAFPLLLKLSGGEVIGCDFLISATGVCSCNDFLNSAEPTVGQGSPTVALDEDGYIKVDKYLRTSIPDVFAAGDCCAYDAFTDRPDLTSNPIEDSIDVQATNNFFQMRLWTQARLMGLLAAHSALDVVDEYGIDMQFEMFAHLTRFFGYKVVMLGRYNAQGLGLKEETLTRQMIVTSEGLQITKPTVNYQSDELCTPNDVTTPLPSSHILPLQPPLVSTISSSQHFELWVRVTPAIEYVKVCVLDGRVVGALLIGDTDLEEVMENLILNRLDVSAFGIGLLDPQIDLGDYFD